MRHAARAAATVALLFLPVVLAGCGGAKHAEAEANGKPVAVTTFRPVRSAEAADVVLAGRVRARDEVTLTARIAGRITSLEAREGSRFHAGDPLVLFDAPETRDALAAARTGLEAATVRRDRARIQEARMDSLYATRLVAKRDLELAQIERQAAEAAWSAAQAAEANLSAGVRITAPFDGVVSRRYVDPGQDVTPGAPLLDLRSHDVREVEVAVPESQVDGLRKARVSFQTGEGPWHPAALVRLDGATDPATRTRLATFRPIESGLGLEAGAWARVRIALEGERPAEHEPAALVIPGDSVVRRGALEGVFVIENGRARLRWLRLGRAFADSVEVLAGLTDSDVVALDPEGLADGSAVTVDR